MKKMVNSAITLSEVVRAFVRDKHNHAEDHFSDNAVQTWRHKESRRGQPEPEGANMRVHIVYSFMFLLNSRKAKECEEG